MSARKYRYEIEKKKQAVRRLSQGAKRTLPSPQGNEKASFRTGLTNEELRQRKQRLLQRRKSQDAEEGNFRSQTQPPRQPMNRKPLGRMDQHRQKGSNPYVWEKGDLRKKLASKDNVSEPLEQKSEAVNPILDDSGLAKPQMRANFNPFAAALKSSENRTTFAETKKPLDTAVQLPVGVQSFKQKNPFGVGSVGNVGQKKKETEGTGNKDLTTLPSNTVLPLKENLFAANQGTAQSNPFALALQSREEKRPIQIHKEGSPKKSVFGLHGYANPKLDSSLGFANPNLDLSHGLTIPKPDSSAMFSNPFAIALQKPEQLDQVSIQQAASSSGIFGQKDQKPDLNLWKKTSDKGNTFGEIAANKQEFDGMSLIASSTAIQLMNVPDELNDKEFLRSFFLRFGEIKRVYRHVSSKSAIITFSDHASAAIAKENGTVLREGYEPIQIFWHVSKTKLPSEMKEDEIFSAMPAAEVRKPMPSSEQPVPKARNNNAFSQMIMDFAKTQLSNSQARDVNEKAEILEKIDQKIREGVKKETDLKKASLVIGTCPDMCPEKERYLREYQRRLAPFEILSGTENADTHSGQFPAIDHAKAIKEYSRSSADQEEPLPHELRPAHILKITMDYLVLNVMDASNGNWAEWYDFVWNRTRGIRKDITQQHLSNEISVELIEKCARFHIICSHHLCEEDLNAFDPKINNENLTKCLQSLKHMYDDLYVQKGIICRNEAEFRCYQVLLNLNNTDILREVMEFRQEVRESPDVKFALEVFRSLNSSNYVRFFKLLGMASYLMACIMQRYFNQIRSKGLLLMNRAYGAVNKPVPVPLNDIARLFSIDEEDEISEFCLHYGFQVDEGMVYFSKSSYEEPETSFLPVRSGAIERKRTCKFGEVVNGKPLPATIDCRPTISFDDQGKYIGKYHELALSGIQQQETDVMPPNTDATTVSTAAIKVTRQDVGQVTVDLISSVVAREVLDLATDTVEQAEQAMKIGYEMLDNLLLETISSETRELAREETESNIMINKILEDLLDEVISPTVRELVSESFAEERKRQNEQNRMLLFQLATETTRTIIDQNVADFAREIAIEAFRDEKYQKFITAVSEASVLIGREMIEKQVSEEVREISNETIEDEIKRRKESLEILKNKVLTSRKSRLFKRWIKEFQTRRHIRETLHDFPACSPLKSSPDVINSLTRSRTHGANLPEYILLKNGAEIAVSSVSSLERKRDRHRNAIEKYHQRLLSERQELLKPLDARPILDAIANTAKRKAAERKVFSKILVCFPDTANGPGDRHIDAKVLKSKFKMGLDAFGQQNETGIESLETLTSATCLHGGVISNFCVEGLSSSFEKDVAEIKKSRELYGVTGIIFITDAKFNAGTWSLEREKLFSILSLKPQDPPLPLLILALNWPESQDESTLIDRLELRRLQDNNLCSSYDILGITDDISGSELNKKLTASLAAMIRKAPKFPGLKTKTLVDFLEQGLESFFYETLYEDGLKRRQIGVPSQDPYTIIELYNGVLDHLINVCTCEKLTSISWPSKSMIFANSRDYPDLNWNSNETFLKLRNLLESLKLPHLPHEARPDDSWDDQLEICLNYIQRVCDSRQKFIHPSKLMCRIEEILNKYKEKWKYRSRSTFLEFPWDSVIEECTIFFLTPFQSQLPLSGIKKDALVSYFEKEYRHYRPALAWIEAASALRNETSVLLNNDSDSIILAHNISSRDEYLQTSIRETNENILKIENSICSVESPSTEEDVTSLLKQLQQKQNLLDESLCSEKQAYSRLSSATDFCISQAGQVGDIAAGSHSLVGVKRKREINSSYLDSSESMGLVHGTDTSSPLNKDKKRPKHLLESRIDDLLKEVHYMRSAMKLDELRFKDVLNS